MANQQHKQHKQHITIQSSESKPQSVRAAWYFALPAVFAAAFCLFAAGYALFSAGFFEKGDILFLALTASVPTIFFGYAIWGRGKLRLIVAILGLLGVAVYLLYYWQDIFIGLRSLILWMVERVNLYYLQNFQTILPIENGVPRANGELHLYIFICILMGFILTSSFSMKRGILWQAILLAPCFWIACNLCEAPERVAVLLLFLAFISGFTLCASRYKRGRTGGGVETGFHNGGFLGNSNVMVFNSKGSGGSIFMWVNGLVVLITTVAILLFPVEQYSTTAPLARLAKDPQTLMENLSFDVFPGLSSGNMGVNGGRLDGNLRHGASTQTHLKLQGERIVPMFLKGYTGAVYEGNRWADLPAESYERLDGISKKYAELELTVQSHYKPLLDLFKETYPYSDDTEHQLEYPEVNIQSSLAIENIAANKRFTYLPYNNLIDPFSDSQWSIDQYINDSYIADKSDGSYLMEYILLLDSYSQETGAPYYVSDIRRMYIPVETIITDSASITEAFRRSTGIMRDYLLQEYNSDLASKGSKILDQIKSEAFSEYEQFVYDNYLDVTGNYEDFFDIAKWELMSNSDPQTIVKKYLEKHAVYDYEPGRVPDGKDYVEYFLYENHRGYCTHFATAATQLFRTIGIPARYVEGYVVTDANIEASTEITSNGNPAYNTAVVPASNAHSWVEIWQGISGWQPVEVTPGFSRTAIAPPSFEHPLPEDMATTSIPESSAPISSEAVSEPSSDVSSASASSTLSSTTTSDTVTDNDDSNEQSGSLGRLAVILISIVACIALAIGLLFAARYLVTARRKRLHSLSDTNRSAIHGYKYFTAQMAFLGYRIQKIETENQFASRLSLEEAIPLREQIIAVTSLALRARFDGVPLTLTEVSLIWEVADGISQELSKTLPMGKRLIFMYIFYL